VKQLFWDNKAEWTFSAFDIARRNVPPAWANRTFKVAGEIATKGRDRRGAAAHRRMEAVGQSGPPAYALTDFDVGDNHFTGNTPPNVAPIVANVGASYRYEGWWWPVEIGGSVRHVGARSLREDNEITIERLHGRGRIRVRGYRMYRRAGRANRGGGVPDRCDGYFCTRLSAGDPGFAHRAI